MSDDSNRQTGPGGGEDLDGLFAKGAAALQTGRAAEAEAVFGQVLDQAPNHPDALNLLGVALFQQGRVAEGAELVARAVAVDGANASYHANLGGILNQLARYAEAEAACRRSIELQPANSGAQNNLGLALESQGKRGEAVAAFRRAVESDPGNVLAFNSLGNALRRMDRLEEAIEAYRGGLKAAPDHAMTLANLGAVLRGAGRMSEALEACREAIAAAPRFAVGHNNLGNVLKAVGDKAGALAAYREASRLDPDYGEPRANLGAIHYEAGDMAEAEAAFNEALARNPDNPFAQNGLGVVLLATGRAKAAATAFRRAVDLKPDYAEAFYNLVSADPKAMEEKEIAALEAALKSGNLSDADRYRLHFTLGDSFDKRDLPARAFPHYRDGNRLRREVLARMNRRHDNDLNDKMVGNLMGFFTKEFFAKAPISGEMSEKPVFIVGLPRSGTTLAEQIAASHPAVFGAGEAESIAPLAARLAKAARKTDSFPEAVRELDAKAAQGLGRLWFDRFEPVGGAARRIIDKTPFNFHFLGLIALLFPKARIIHCQRDPRDTGLSCFMQNFRAALPWTTDLGDIGRYWLAYDRLMAHWRDVLPIPLLNLVYEDMVADQEGQTRRLIDFLGLDWDDACLQFHRNDRVVRTASFAQVRRPIYSSSVGRWKVYEKDIQPLLDILDGTG